MFFGIFVLYGSNRRRSFARAKKKIKKRRTRTEARGRSATIKPRPQAGRQLTI